MIKEMVQVALDSAMNGNASEDATSRLSALKMSLPRSLVDGEQKPQVISSASNTNWPNSVGGQTFADKVQQPVKIPSAPPMTGGPWQTLDMPITEVFVPIEPLPSTPNGQLLQAIPLDTDSVHSEQLGLNGSWAPIGSSNPQINNEHALLQQLQRPGTGSPRSCAADNAFSSPVKLANSNNLHSNSVQPDTAAAI